MYDSTEKIQRKGEVAKAQDFDG